ncbi:MAG: hypothetical protein KMY54_04120 [Erysipelothrix sp.]|nr:hypothetical protein [Erysipelothrix sp.]
MKHISPVKIIIFGFSVFLLSMVMFYSLFLLVTPVVLTLQNHIGFFIWSFLPAAMMTYALLKRRWIGFSILFIAIIAASSSLIFESLSAKAIGTGNISAVLSYILIMIFSMVSVVVIEGFLWIIRTVRKNTRNQRK